MPGGVPVLLFHHVGPPVPGTPPSLTVVPGRFRKLMLALRRTGHVGISAAEWSSAASTGGRGERPVVITFDDGYADLTSFALPVLGELGFRATVFVVAGALGGTNTWDSHSHAGDHRIMSTDDLRAWVQAGCEIGAHGVTHTDLTTLTAEQVVAEMEQSQRTLSELARVPVTSFAYPYGAQNPQVRAAALGTFRLAFGVEPGRNDGATDRSRLRRTMVQPADTTVDVVLRARLGWSPLQSVRATLRLRSRMSALLGRGDAHAARGAST